MKNHILWPPARAIKNPHVVIWKQRKPSKFSRHMKQGQRHRTFHFFKMAKGTQEPRGNGTHKTGDTRNTTGHREHKGHRGYKGHGTHETGDTRDTGNIRDTKHTGDTRGHRATSSPGRFSLPYRPKCFTLCIFTFCLHLCLAKDNERRTIIESGRDFCAVKMNMKIEFYSLN